ncbi:MAG: lytic transglycosylase domain-containing protein [Rhodanobacter sp.]|jgi:soluble lytic murein transglycosylase-like protein|nr:lytic transglycosylase domain-containing protein [Rhodanobacter sp.]
MPRFHRFAIAMLVPAFLGGPALASAGVLYKCAAGDGSIAYVSSTTGFSHCNIVSIFPDTPKSQVAKTPSPAPDASQSRHRITDTSIRRGWVYEEDHADFSNVKAAVQTVPPHIVRADFSHVYGVAMSTARIIEPKDFSTVQADVASTARMMGRPLLVAAPYRMPARAQQPMDGEASVASRTLRGAVYRVQRTNGVTEYTNIKPDSGRFAMLFTYIATCFACDADSRVDFARASLNVNAYKDEVTQAAADYGVDVALLRAVIHAESAFNPMAISNRGARGLMQLMPGTADDLGVTDVFDATQNIRGGARYLAQLLRDFNGDVQLATAAYNAGSGAVQKYHGVPPYDETQVYVQRVATLRDRYQKAL